MTKPLLSMSGHGPLTQWPLNREALRIPQALWRNAQTESLYRTASRIFLGLDYDGTLVPIAPSPSEARPSPELLAILTQLSEDPTLTVAIVSGRQLSELCALISVPGLTYIGTHGAELCTANGDTRQLVPTGVLTMTVARLQRELLPVFAHVPGLLLENKRFALALHYRLAPPEVEEWAIGQFVAVVQDHLRKGLALEIIYGKKVIEVRQIGINKGHALRTLLATALPMTLPIYIGDDQTDEDAFQFLDGRGLTILVADHPRPTAAHYLLSNPREVLRFLVSLRALRGSSHSV
jgi:trehalose 6-phosphate phosphatase